MIEQQPDRDNNDSHRHSDSPELDIKVSDLAVFSCVLAVVSLLALMISSSTAIIAGALAVLFGISSLIRITRSHGLLTGYGFAIVGIALPSILFVFALLIIVRVRFVSYQLLCSKNLSKIGRAMLIYSNDHDGELPHAGGGDSQWGPTPNWQAVTAAEAYGLNDGPGQASISANFYLLVKYVELTPKSFICKGDEDATYFTPAEYNVRDKELVDLWDFGPDPSKHCSYTYHLPYGKYPLSASSDPRMAIAADRNPWLDSPGQKARVVTDWSRFDPNGTRELTRFGNAITHQNDGQNVLFLDGHTAFQKTAACGVDNDNIYTSQNAASIMKGVLPTLTSQPASKTDSLLLHDPPPEEPANEMPRMR